MKLRTEYYKIMSDVFEYDCQALCILAKLLGFFA